MEKVDIVIIGAGVVGLAIAKEVTVKERNIVVVERNKSFGQETSSRNSEVIHSGIYYTSGTLKAKMCVEGRHLLYDICQKNNIAYKKLGKFIVATKKEEIPHLNKLFLQGKNNGIDNLKMIGQQELKNKEPNIFGLLALYSPETGIVESHRLMQYFLDYAKSNGAIIAYNSDVIGIEKLSYGYKVSVKNDNDIYTFKTQIVINCAGLDSDRIAQMVNIDIKKFKYELHYCKGQYFRVNSDKSSLIRKLIYPVPQPKSGGLGIHATLDLGGGLRLGPDDEYLKTKNKDYSVTNSKRYNFYASAKKFMPFLEEEDLSPDMSGIRPKLQGPNDDFRDFIIQEETEKGFPGFINLIGIESPGLTASPAIGKYIKSLIEDLS